jgi:excisionase family DNA binding protein
MYPSLRELPPLTERLQVSIKEAAILLGFSVRTVYKLIADGELSTIGRGRLRRIAVADIRRWQDRNRDVAA